MRFFALYLCVCLLAAAPAPAPALAAQPTPGAGAQPGAQQVFATTPRPRADGAKWRIGYVESGEYSEYPRTLRALVQGLQKLGWLEIEPIPDDLSGRATWEFVARHARSAELEFVADAWWQPGNFDASLRAPMRAEISARLQRHDLDLLLAMGTWAGQDMVQLGAPIPTIVASVSDAVGAHIVKSLEDSGLDNLHARVQPERYQRQLHLFHEIVPFKTLGMVYEDSPEGRTYAALDAVEQVAAEAGFGVQSCNAVSHDVSSAQATQNAIDCYREVAARADAVYVTTHRGITDASIKDIARILQEQKVPSFSMAGSAEVRAGILMSLAQADYSFVGLFYAETMARVFNGALPRALSQIWVDPAKIAINLNTARVIGFDPPVDILLAADEVYQGSD